MKDKQEIFRTNHLTDLGFFGATWNGTLVLGSHITEQVTFNKPGCWSGRGQSKPRNAYYLHEYNFKESEWLPIQSSGTNQLFVNYNVDDVNSYCRIGDSILVLKTSTSMRLIHLNNYPFTKLSLEVKGIKNVQTLKATYTKLPSSSTNFPRQLKHINECAITQVEENKVMLIGGIYNAKHVCNGEHVWNCCFNKKSCFNRRLWQGTLTKEGNDITWMALDLELTKVRLAPICFKLQDSLYIAGGETIDDWNDKTRGVKGLTKKSSHKSKLLCCDKYDLKNGKYYESVYFLPYPLSGDDMVVTNVEETFAIVSNKYNEKLLMFTGKDGFTDISSVLLNASTKCWPAIFLKIK